MSPDTLFTIIIAIIVFNFALSRVLEFLNARKYGDPIPEELDDIYDGKEYRKSMDYKKVNYRFAILTGAFSFVLILAMFMFDGFAFADDLVRRLTEHPVLTALLFFGLLMLASDILNTPFAVWDTFVIEERFGFNKTTVKTFITDKLKSWMIGAIIGGGLLAAIIGFYLLAGKNFWIYALALIAAYVIFLNMFYSVLIVPLFNKQTPLEDGELRDAITGFSKKAGFRLSNVFVIDSSKRSTKANAYFTGLGSRKRVVLYDTLIKDLGTEEIVSVLAHEIGHYKKKHVMGNVILTILQNGIVLYILSLFVDSPLLSEALGASVPSFHIGLIAFGILYSPLSLILGIGSNILSRQNEYQADRYAGEMHRPESLISALKGMSRKNLSNLTPHPAYVFFHYSHPPLYQRVIALRGLKKK
jgi:STE24 endopeptidase